MRKIATWFRDGLSGGRFAVRAGTVFAAAWLVCLAPFVFEGTVPGGFGADTNRNLPFRTILRRALAHGDFPDLAAGMYLGQPLMSIGQPAPLYPTNLFGLIVPLPDREFLWFDLWVHAALAAAGMAWWLRRRGAGAAMALALGWAYSCSSVFLFRLDGHWTLVHQAAWMPWLLAAWEGLDGARSGWRGGAAGRWLFWSVALAVALLAQNPQWLYLLAILLCPLEAWRIWRRRARLAPGRRAVALVASVALAAALGAGPLWPLVAGLGDSFRGAIAGPDLARGWPLHPLNLIALVSPYLFFGAKHTEFYGPWWPNESLVAAGRGVALLALAGAAALLARPRRWLGRGALPGALLAGGLAIGMAPALGYFEALCRALPMFDSFRAWGRAGLFVAIALILFAAEGARALFRAGNRTRERRAAAVAALAAALGLAAGALAFRAALLADPPAAMGWLARGGLAFERFRGDTARIWEFLFRMRSALARDAAVYGAWAAALMVFFSAGIHKIEKRTARARWAALAFLAAEALLFQRFAFRERTALLTPESRPQLSAWLRERRAAAAPAPFTAAFTESVYLNFAAHFEGVRGTHGSDSNMRRRYAEWLNALEGRPPTYYQLETDVRAWVPEFLDATALGARVEPPGFTPPAGEPGWRILDGLRVFEYPDPPPWAEFKAVEDGSPPAGMIPGGSRVRVLEWRDGRGGVEVEAEHPGRLVIREFPDPRWRIFVNGGRVEASPSPDRLVIPLAAGLSRVEIHFVDTAARLGYAVSLLAWAALAAALLRRRKL